MGKRMSGAACVRPLRAVLLAILSLGLPPFFPPATVPSAMAASVTWTATSAPPSTMSEHAVVAYSSRRYLIGGWGPGGRDNMNSY